MDDATRSRVCGSFGCKLPIGHNMGRADIPENHDPHATPDRAAVKVPYKLAQRIRLALDHAHRDAAADHARNGNDSSYHALAGELIDCDDYPIDLEPWP